MSNLNIHDNYRFFGAKDTLESLQADDKKKLNAAINKIYFNLPEIRDYLASCSGRYTLSIRPNAVAVKSTEGAVLRIFPVHAKESREARRIDRIGRYYQNLGYIGRDLSKDQNLKETSGSQVLELSKSSVPGLKEKIYTGVKVGDNALALARDILSVHPNVGPNNTFVNNAGIVAGSIWSFFAIREVMSGMDDLGLAREIGDEEGKRRAGARLGGGVLSMMGSALYLSGKAWDLAGGIGLAPAAMGLTTNLFFGAGSILGMGMAGLGLYRCFKFRQKVNRYLDNPNKNLTPAVRLKGALRFLKDAMSVTPEERIQLIQKIDAEHPFWSPSRKQELLQIDLERLTETKVKYMKRRTSIKSLKLLLDPKKGIDALLPLLEQGKGVKETEELLENVKTETWKKIGLYMIGFFVSLIGLFAILAGTFGTFGALPFILFGITAATYLIFSLDNLRNQLFKTESDLPGGLNVQPLALSASEAHEFH